MGTPTFSASVCQHNRGSVLQRSKVEQKGFTSTALLAWEEAPIWQGLCLLRGCIWIFGMATALFFLTFPGGTLHQALASADENLLCACLPDSCCPVRPLMVAWVEIEA